MEQVAHDVLQVVQMWVDIYGYVPLGHDELPIQLTPLRKDSYIPLTVQELHDDELEQTAH